MVWGLFQELTNDPVNSPHSQPVTSIDSRWSPLRFSYEITIEVRLWKIQLLYAALGHNTAIIGLKHHEIGSWIYLFLALTPMMSPAFFSICILSSTSSAGMAQSSATAAITIDTLIVIFDCTRLMYQGQETFCFPYVKLFSRYGLNRGVISKSWQGSAGRPIPRLCLTWCFYAYSTYLIPVSSRKFQITKSKPHCC